MRILLQSSRETKTEFFGKYGWSFHSVQDPEHLSSNSQMIGMRLLLTLCIFFFIVTLRKLKS
jgi:hypothetical protein